MTGGWSSSGTPRAVVLFDGVCNLCNTAVQFLIARDPNARLKFASLQSEAGRTLLASHRLPRDYRGSLVLIQDGRAYIESDAALRLTVYLSWPWSLLRMCRWLPRVVRDAVYRLIAKHRYQWFGRSTTCAVPSPQLRSRFL
jgi:predicted DCC family thiol-disulfide oxidoreductase YuxK